MLRDNREVKSDPGPRSTRFLTFTALAAAVLALAGIRGPIEGSLARAQDEPAPKAEAPGTFKPQQTDPLALVPEISEMVLVARPHEILNLEGMSDVLKKIGLQENVESAYGLAPQMMEFVALVWLGSAPAEPYAPPIPPPVAGHHPHAQPDGLVRLHKEKRPRPGRDDLRRPLLHPLQ